MKTGDFSILLVFLLLLVGSLRTAPAQTYDISSGGPPIITGALNGSVTGSSSVLNNLSVTINFGEVSPFNTNRIVKVVVPIAIRSDQQYKVTAKYSGSTNANVQALQKKDIGFGVNNFRSMGANASVCTNSRHILYAPFNNDPASNVTISASGRAAYPSTLNNIGVSTTILSGPSLSNTNNNQQTDARQTDDGYIFNAIFVITPQFYAAGSTSVTLTFTISAGPRSPC